MSVADHLVRPTREYGSEPLLCPSKRAVRCLALLPVGDAWPVLSPEPPVGYYSAFSPLPPANRRRIVSVALLRRIAPPGRYPAPCPVEFGLSSGGSRPPAAARSPCASASYHAEQGASRGRLRLERQCNCHSNIMRATTRNAAISAIEWLRARRAVLARRPVGFGRLRASSNRRRRQGNAHSRQSPERNRRATGRPGHD